MRFWSAVVVALTALGSASAVGAESPERRAISVVPFPLAVYLPATAESIRGTLLGKALIGEAALDEALEACRRHLADPDTVFTTFLVAQAWGRKPRRSRHLTGPRDCGS